VAGGAEFIGFRVLKAGNEATRKSNSYNEGGQSPDWYAK
jgi:hypothetical protein